MRLLLLAALVGAVVGGALAATSPAEVQRKRLLACQHDGALYRIGRDLYACYVPPGARVGWLRSEP